MKNQKVSKINKNLRYFLWTLVGILVLSISVLAVNTFSNSPSAYMTAGNFTLNETKISHHNAQLFMDNDDILNQHPLIHLIQRADSTSYYGPEAMFIENYGNSTAFRIYQQAELGYHYNALDVTSAIAQIASNQGLVSFRLTNNLSTDTVLQVWNEGTGKGIDIVSKGDAEGLKVSNYGTTTTKYALSSYALGGAVNTYLRQDYNQTNLEVNKISTGSGTNALFKSFGTGDNVQVVTYGASRGIFVDQDYDAVGISIDTEATTSSKYGLEIYTLAGATNLFSRQDGNFENVLISKIGTGAGNNVRLLNDGTGTNVFVDQNGDGKSLHIDSESTSYSAIVIDDIPSNKSIEIATNDKICMNGATCSYYLVYNGTCIIAVGSGNSGGCI